MFRKVAMTMVAVVALGVVAGQAAAAPILLDDYTSSANSGAGLPGAKVTLPASTDTQTLAGTNIAAGLGGQRGFSLTGVTGSTPLTASLLVAGGLLVYNNDAGVTSTGTLDYTGSIDLTGAVSIDFDASNFSAGTGGAALPVQVTLLDGIGGVAVGVGIINADGTYSLPLIATPGFNFGAVAAISLSFDGTTGAGADVAIDNLRVTTNVPEPSTLICFGIGIACVAGVRAVRRNRRVAA